MTNRLESEQLEKKHETGQVRRVRGGSATVVNLQERREAGRRGNPAAWPTLFKRQASAITARRPELIGGADRFYRESNMKLSSHH